MLPLLFLSWLFAADTDNTDDDDATAAAAAAADNYDCWRLCIRVSI